MSPADSNGVGHDICDITAARSDRGNVVDNGRCTPHRFHGPYLIKGLIVVHSASALYTESRSTLVSIVPRKMVQAQQPYRIDVHRRVSVGVGFAAAGLRYVTGVTARNTATACLNSSSPVPCRTKRPGKRGSGTLGHERRINTCQGPRDGQFDVLHSDGREKRPQSATQSL
ncbi:hypothetical protein EXIGLDRAFT_356176 [Exidia glandulosa HHB12029]|uniref:Uncharacterized protein n=1 Tax=Exidia glandulosa HHB12029 TaxID=1314781 RepID=A0A165C9S3_EXIGL|nr:hypothetical protein EXIGLDRAFT_356176 [Exidia glandulosa HHB12029]